MNINDLIDMIPEDAISEALVSIQSIAMFPAKKAARLNCYFTSEFKVLIEIKNNNIVISAHNREEVICNEADFLRQLIAYIYSLDEAISTGSYTPEKPKSVFVIERPQPPAYMDLPTWDEKTNSYYDAET